MKHLLHNYIRPAVLRVKTSAVYVAALCLSLTARSGCKRFSIF